MLLLFDAKLGLLVYNHGLLAPLQSAIRLVRSQPARDSRKQQRMTE